MSSERALSPSIIKASKKAAGHDYDKSQYIIVNMDVRRDGSTGRLVTKDEDKQK